MTIGDFCTVIESVYLCIPWVVRLEFIDDFKLEVPVLDDCFSRIEGIALYNSPFVRGKVKTRIHSNTLFHLTIIFHFLNPFMISKSTHSTSLRCLLFDRYSTSSDCWCAVGEF